MPSPWTEWHTRLKTLPSHNLDGGWWDCHESRGWGGGVSRTVTLLNQRFRDQHCFNFLIKTDWRWSESSVTFVSQDEKNMSRLKKLLNLFEYSVRKKNYLHKVKIILCYESCTHVAESWSDYISNWVKSHTLMTLFQCSKVCPPMFEPAAIRLILNVSVEIFSLSRQIMPVQRCCSGQVVDNNFISLVLYFGILNQLSH